MATTRKAKVTDETLQEAHLLRQIWESNKPDSQAAFGEAFEIGTQSAVGQFLRGETPLGLKAAAGFARSLKCHIADFSPRLADQARLYAEISGVHAGPGDELERQLLLFFRQMPEEKKDALIAMANGWANMASPERTKAHPADPFRNAPPRTGAVKSTPPIASSKAKSPVQA